VKEVLKALKATDAIAAKARQRTFAHQLAEDIRLRKVSARRFRQSFPADDVLGLIQASIKAKDFDNAVWYSFIAAHFGRTSVATDEEATSSFRFIAKFGKKPFWTWERIKKNRDAFKAWMLESGDDLTTVQFGNHRKHETKHDPAKVWRVMNSFLDLCDEYGGPSSLLEVDEDERHNEFDALFRRFKKLHRFARLGKFDFLILLHDMGLIQNGPKSCYIKGATGPKRGAIRMWGDLGINELDSKADLLATTLKVSPIAVEDSLCKWQK
jgi:hypothetical protein